MLTDALASRATKLFPFSRKYGVYFADAEIVVRRGEFSETRIGASSLAVGADLAIRKCRNELVERFAQWDWETTDEALPECDLLTAKQLGTTLPRHGRRRDASGTCAGPISHRQAILTHGLLEIVERDAVARFFDHGDGDLYEVVTRPAAPLVTLAGRWGLALHMYGIWQPDLPPTAIALASRGTEAGAIGTAARLSLSGAVTAATCEALMMYTTARHWSRQSDLVTAYEGVVWASNNIMELRGELAAAAAASPVPAHQGPPGLVAAVSAHFGARPTFIAYPLRNVDVAGVGAWRVSVAGATSPAVATRTPWPLG